MSILFPQALSGQAAGQVRQARRQPAGWRALTPSVGNLTSQIGKIVFSANLRNSPQTKDCADRCQNPGSRNSLAERACPDTPPTQDSRSRRRAPHDPPSRQAPPSPLGHGNYIVSYYSMLYYNIRSHFGSSHFGSAGGAGPLQTPECPSAREEPGRKRWAASARRPSRRPPASSSRSTMRSSRSTSR